MKGCTGKMCNECPFKKGSLAGWLGPWRGPGELHRAVVGEAPFACHKTMDDGDENMRVCTGSILYANKVFKRFQNPELRAEQDKAANSPEAEKAMDYHEFMAHHGDI